MSDGLRARHQSLKELPFTREPDPKAAPESDSPAKVRPADPVRILFKWSLLSAFVVFLMGLLFKVFLDFMRNYHHGGEAREVYVNRYKLICLDSAGRPGPNLNFTAECDFWKHGRDENVFLRAFIETLNGFNVCQNGGCSGFFMWMGSLLAILFCVLTLLFYCGYSQFKSAQESRDRRDHAQDLFVDE